MSCPGMASCDGELNTRKKTVLDDIKFTEKPKYDHFRAVQVGIDGHAEIKFEDGYFISREATLRNIEEIQRQLSQKKCIQNIKTDLLKAALDVIYKWHYVNVEPKMKAIADFQIPVVILNEVEGPLLIVPPQDYTKILDAFDKLKEEARKEAMMELGH